MKTLLAYVVVAFVAPAARAADTDDDKAKQVVAAFLKAVKAKDIDAVMRTVDVPFFLGPGGPDEPITKVEELKEKLTAFLGGVDPDDVPTDVGTVLNMPALRKKVSGDEKGKLPEAFETVLGKDGRVVMFLKDGKERGGLLVRVESGKAKVVGVPK